MPYIVWILATWGLPPIARSVPPEPWKKFSDVFHPDVPILLEKHFAWIKDLSNDPYLLGYVVDNEIGWGYSDELVLSADDKSYSKMKLVSLLKERYRTIEKLKKNLMPHGE